MNIYIYGLFIQRIYFHSTLPCTPALVVLITRCIKMKLVDFSMKVEHDPTFDSADLYRLMPNLRLYSISENFIKLVYFLNIETLSTQSTYLLFPPFFFYSGI